MRSPAFSQTNLSETGRPTNLQHFGPPAPARYRCPVSSYGTSWDKRSCTGTGLGCLKGGIFWHFCGQNEAENSRCFPFFGGEGRTSRKTTFLSEKSWLVMKKIWDPRISHGLFFKQKPYVLHGLCCFIPLKFNEKTHQWPPSLIKLIDL